MKVGMMGDTHGFYPSVKRCLLAIRKAEPEVDHVFHLGDFGIYPDDQELFKLTQNRLARLGMSLSITPGNHEDWDYINSLIQPGKLEHHLGSNLRILGRGWSGNVGGTKFTSLGGAPSVDRTYRQQHPNWPWSEKEVITEDDLARLDTAEVMLAHDAPWGSEEIEKRIGFNPHGFAIRDLHYANFGRGVMTQAAQIVQPKAFFHGHYHFRVDEEVKLPSGHTLHQYGLAADGNANSWGVFDTETLEFTWGDLR